MISKLINLFFLWRRNNLPSIVFKSLFWGMLAWLAVGIFTELRAALIAGGAAVALAAVKYLLQNRRENAQLLKMVGGDSEKLKALRKKTSAKGAAGGFMTEMLRQAALEEEEEDDDEEVVELSAEQKQTNVVATTATIEKMASLCVEGGYVSTESSNETKEELLANYADGEYVPELVDVLEEFLPDNVLQICTEDYCNEDDHAGLMELFARATNGKWNPGECHSSFDEEQEQWLVHFSENGTPKTWRFQQSGDWLSEKFLQQLIAYTQAQSGHTITVLDAEDFVSAVCLPVDLHQALFGQDQQIAA